MKNEGSLVSNSAITHLIVVAGHSVILNGDFKNAGTDENLW